MWRAFTVLAAAAYLTTVATAQSIMVSGGRPSIFVGGKGAPAVQPANHNPPTQRPPVYVATPQQPAPVPQNVQEEVVTERWLVSEPWCQHCPAAKRRFLSSGGPANHIITIAQALAWHGRQVLSVPFEYTTSVRRSVVRRSSAVRPQFVQPRQVRSRLPVVQTQWGTIDLETYHRNCNCPMCQGIRALQQQYRYQSQIQSQYKEAGQSPTPDNLITEMLALMDLRSDDLLCDLGCGDGRILISAAQSRGCRGIGVEIDPVKAEEARSAVAAAGLADQIQIITGDALDFSVEGHGVTALVTYLYPELLEKLAGKYATVRVGASPFHEVPGLKMTRQGDIWMYRT